MVDQGPPINGTRQMALAFGHRPRFERNGFIAASSNRAALAWLSEASWPEGRLALWGESGVGKTHLLKVWAQERNALMFSGSVLNTALLEKVQSDDSVCHIAIDDADCVRDEALFVHLLNLARERSVSVLMAAQAPPARWPVRLADLASRLRAIAAVPLGQPDDDLSRILLMQLLAERQIVVAQAVVEWLLRHLPRTTAAIHDAVEKLDHAGLAHGEAITRTLAARVLAGNLDIADGSGYS